MNKTYHYCCERCGLPCDLFVQAQGEPAMILDCCPVSNPDGADWILIKGGEQHE